MINFFINFWFLVFIYRVWFFGLFGFIERFEWYNGFCGFFEVNVKILERENGVDFCILGLK